MQGAKLDRQSGINVSTNPILSRRSVGNLFILFNQREDELICLFAVSSLPLNIYDTAHPIHGFREGYAGTETGSFAGPRRPDDLPVRKTRATPVWFQQGHV